MPPRKRQRQSVAGSPAPEPQAKSTSPAAPDAAAAADAAAILNDPWTDDEEIGLFKGLMRWKPTGIHKNFRLLALHAWLLENNYIHPKHEHTRPKGLWEKLNTLYDLPALDAREDARQLSPLRTTAEQEQDEADEDDDADIYSVAANKIENDEFDLSAIGDGFDDMMWKARFPEQAGDESDPELPDLNLAKDPPVRFTPSFSIEPSEAATPGSRKGKSSTAKARGGRGGAAAATRRSARKTESVADKEEEQGEGDDEGDEEDESSEDDEEEDESETESQGPRRGRSSKSTRGKPAGRARGRGRGRGK